MGIGTNLKKILSDKNMTIKELSEKSGVSLNTLYSITKRDSNMSRYDIIEKIALTLNVTVKELTGYEIDEPNTDIQNARHHEIIKDNTIFKKRDKTLFESLTDLLLYLTQIYPTDDKTLEMNELFMQLNDSGQDKAIEQVELLTKIPEYQKEPEE